MNGLTHKIETLSIDDGPGMRAVVFMQGCNMRCVYCHNADTWNMGLGTQTTPKELASKLVRYKRYYENGGVTFSGGEPLLQAEFLAETIALLKNEGLHTCIDTACSILNPAVEKAYNLCDLVIADLKFTSKEDYIKYARADVFDAVIASLKYLNSIGKDIILRTVVVPNINDTKESIEAYANLVKSLNIKIKAYELKPFHTLGFSKYQALGIANPLEGVKALEPETLQKLWNYLRLRAT
jgi:pyruvate formate lyase activating enzyme